MEKIIILTEKTNKAMERLHMAVEKIQKAMDKGRTAARNLPLERCTPLGDQGAALPTTMLLFFAKQPSNFPDAEGQDKTKGRTATHILP
ncbi:MAG: hypothetical protein IPH57_08395 [Saprospiraceae bacterium]|nr:hypothetical protein [Saprospiraceae bacterium]